MTTGASGHGERPAGRATSHARTGTFAHLDGLRGLAVLAVIVHHACIGTVGPAYAPYWNYAGARGVDLFFALSGCCLSLRAFDGSVAVRSTIGTHVAFVVARLARIAPPYYAALAAFALLSLTPFGFPSATTVADPHSAAVWWEMFRDALFCPPRSPVHDVSFWTLGIEFRWYLLCPLLIATFVRSKVAFALVFVGCYALYASPWSIGDAGMLPCFMLGIVAAWLAYRPDGRFERFASFGAPVALVAACVLQARAPTIDHGVALWHVACFLTIVAGGRGIARRVLGCEPLRRLGVASYAIYLVHEPVQRSLVESGTSPVVSSIVAIAVGFAFHVAVERPLGGSVRRALEARVLGALRRLWRPFSSRPWITTSS